MTNIPIKSHHCNTTHSACDCVLDRLKKLEKVAEAAKEYVDDETMNIGVWKLKETLKDLERE